MLLGLDFSMDSNVVHWNKSSPVKIISVFTDNPFHVEFDSADRGSETAPSHAWWIPEPTYRFHNPEAISLLSDQLDGNIPFSLDFYITANTEDVLDQYEKYFLASKEASDWFVLRKMFQSPNIADSFKEKMVNMEFIIKQADYINDIFSDKCDDKISPEEGIINYTAVHCFIS